MGTQTQNSVGYVVGPVRMLLRLEGLLVFALSVLFYARSGGGWGRFAALFFVPDLSFAGYLLGGRVGAAAYNTMHSYCGPIALFLTSLLAGAPSAAGLALIWAAHVGIDRALGYGLKYGSGFADTHLGPIGRARTEMKSAAAAATQS
jgi:hypothetical protein